MNIVVKPRTQTQKRRYMLTLQALANMKRSRLSQRDHTELCHRKPETHNGARYQAKPVCGIQSTTGKCATLHTVNIQNKGELQPPRKKFLLRYKPWHVTTSSVNQTEQYVFIEICSFNSIFNLQLVKITKSIVLSIQKKVYR